MSETLPTAEQLARPLLSGLRELGDWASRIDVDELRTDAALGGEEGIARAAAVVELVDEVAALVSAAAAMFASGPRRTAAEHAARALVEAYCPIGDVRRDLARERAWHALMSA
jgi:hypothetical protein